MPCPLDEFVNIRHVGTCPDAFTVLRSDNHVTTPLYKSLSVTERRPEAGVKNGFEEVEHKFQFGTFRPEKQDYLFTCSVAPGKVYFPTGFSGNFL